MSTEPLGIGLLGTGMIATVNYVKSLDAAKSGSAIALESTFRDGTLAPAREASLQEGDDI